MLLVRFIGTVRNGEPIEERVLVTGPDDACQVMATLGSTLPGLMAAIEKETPMSLVITIDKVLKILPKTEGQPS
jgi:hypothetical protein